MESYSSTHLSTWSMLVSGLACGIVCGWLLRGKIQLSRRPSFISCPETSTSEIVKAPKIDLLLLDDGAYKLILVVRKDLNMGKGKAAAQCCHATADVIKKLIFKNPEMLMAWEECGQPKVVVKGEDEDHLLALEKEARSFGLVTSMIRDAGRTQIARGSLTVLGVGPGPVQLIDKVTGGLKLY